MTELALNRPENGCRRTGRLPEMLAYAGYLALLIWTMLHHELWGDEIHSWNIAKASGSWTDLIQNSRYEGHPPVWYTLMWAASGISRHPGIIQILQVLIAGGAMALLVFRSPLPRMVRCLLPFGYYFLYEYGVLSRNYAPALLVTWMVLLVWQSSNRFRTPVYYLLLLLLSNTHLLGAILASAIHAYTLLERGRFRPGILQLPGHALAGAVVILPALYIIFPPADSEMNVDFWIRLWDTRQLITIATAPLKAFSPIPAWWDHHFWNNHFLLNLQEQGCVPLLLLYAGSASCLALALFILHKDRNSVLLFLINVLLTAAAGIIFPLTSARYVGFLFIGFMAAVWCCSLRRPFSPLQIRCLYLLLSIQVTGSLIALPADLRERFSNASLVPDILQSVPAGERVVSDYYCLNNVLAYTDRPVYCIETNRSEQFILWDQETKRLMHAEAPYTEGAKQFLAVNGGIDFFMLSANAPEKVRQMDPRLFSSFEVRLVDQRQGAIERYSDLYLYHICRK